MADELKKNNKIEARAEALIRLKKILDSSVEDAQRGLDFHLSSFLKTYTGRWGCFSPMVGEASPRLAIQENQHLEWAYPKINGENLDFFVNPGSWQKGKFGIEEPNPSQSEQVSVHTLNGYLIPGLAFDRWGTRLGRGWGYFDRALESFTGLRVGVSFEALVFAEALPRESFDVPVDVLITEQGVLFINSKGDRRND
ncbi:MAG: hypothetical protein RJB66_1380 [Pseudomonadota bacterium]|jgi:5-formyltetrahydrofolate cyclo-ligase